MDRIARMAGQLLDWYSEHARKLPWREVSDPYAIWISEVMLQQTQVKTVIPYWSRWMGALPDVASLARVDESRLLKLWEGLGYYRRARHLQAAARVILEKHGGLFPSAFEDVLALPGVGQYTAGAICSIAFNEPVPAVDGNIMRVLTRVGAIPGDPREREVRDQLWKRARELMQAAAASGRSQACSHLNQALMELGATVCAPRAPACGRCPLARGCRARREGRPERFPEARARPAVTEREYVVVVARAGDAVRVCQRPAAGVNGGLWEFPNEEVTLSARTPESVARALFGLRRVALAPLGIVRHSITRYRIRTRVYLLDRPTKGIVARGPGRWLARADLDSLPFTGAHRRIVDRLNSTAWPR